MPQKSNQTLKTTKSHHWKTKAQNASRASLAHCYTMVEQWTKSDLSELVPLDPNRPPQKNSQKKQSTSYLITVLHTLPMEYSIAPVTWFCVRILTQDFTTKAKATAEQELTFFFPKTMPCPYGTAQFSLLPKLLNSSCPPLQKQNWRQFSLQPKKW